MSVIGEHYIILPMIQVKQLDSGIVLAGKIKFSELNQVYKFTERTEKNGDSFFDDRSLEKVRADQKEAQDEFFQRQLSDQKVNSIKNFLNDALDKGDGSVALFPSSVILYNRPYEDDDLQTNEEIVSSKDLTENIIADSYRDDLECCFFVPAKEFQNHGMLYIPKNPNITLIVDGQHRFAGTKKLYDSFQEGSDKKQKVGDFEFIVTFLYGFDIHEVAKIFADVNFTQKPVNRSLYYDIFGSAPRTDSDGNKENEIRLAHDLAVHLNNSDKSPIKGMIKLLGKGDGLFSQAFFVDHMRDHVFKSKVWNHLLIDYLNEGKEYRVIAEFMRAYFSALKKAYPTSWPEKVSKTVGEKQEDVYSSYHYKNIMCKTTGMGAYIRLIKDIYPLVEKEPSQFEHNILKIFQKISDDEAFKLFEKSEGIYGGRSGEGVQSDLYKELRSRYDLQKQKRFSF